MRLREQIAVVTGGGSGIGRAICEAYAREGAKLAVLDLNEATAKETAKELPGEGHQAFACDVASGPGVVEAFAAVDAAFGGVDVLVNNAGIDRAPGDGMDQLKRAEKEGDISKDEHHKIGDEVQHLTDDTVKQINELLAQKEAEIMTV